MSHFEFIAIAISIIFAMTLGRLVAGLPQVAGRSPPDYLQLAFLITLIAHQILLWWRMWMLSSIEQWNFLGYFLMVVAPLSYYLTAIALVDSPETRNPDRAFSHRWFFSALAAAWTIGAINSWYLLDIRPYVVGIIIPVMVAAAILDKRWIHVLVLGLVILSFFLAAVSEFTL